MNKFWQELLRLQGTILHMTSSYHSQSNGQTEVVNRCLETYYVVLQLSSHDSGLAGFLGQNFGTIPISIFLLGLHLLRQCMEENLLQWCNTSQVK